MAKFRTPYNVSEFDKPVEVFTMPTMTQQHFKDECDINVIVDRYKVTGVLGDPLDTRTPVYGDFSSMPEFIDAQNIIARASEQFASLPSDVRKRFDNNPALMLEFLQDENNREEAVKLGLVNPVISAANLDTNIPTGSVDNFVDN